MELTPLLDHGMQKSLGSEPKGGTLQSDSHIILSIVMFSETAAFRYTFRPHPNGMGTNEGHYVNQHAELGLR